MTHIVYSHHHADHLGASSLFGRNVTRIGQAGTRRLLAEENRVNLHLLPPLRGKIVDRFGTALAINNPNYRVVIVPEQTADMRETLRTLARILPLTPEAIDRLLRDLRVG